MPAWIHRHIRSSLLGLLVLLAALLPLAAPAADSPTVVAGGEQLVGFRAGAGQEVAAFLGVPFAAPPTGNERWRAPAPHVSRPGPRQATRFAPACMQGSSGVDWYVSVAATFGAGPEVVGRPLGVSEDCLYLNIWTPTLDPGAALPVMVFVHGGSNKGGWSYEPNYLGAALARKGVVVVTVAYRLGPFGFFAHPALGGGEREAEANFGQLDIRAAFGWLRENARAFGGDPDNVTAFGESSGAFDLVDLLLAELDAGGERSFRRLIVQSIGGSLYERQTLAEEQAVGLQLLEWAGIGADATAAEIRAVPAADLLAAAQKLPSGHYFDAVIDGRTLRATPATVMERASAAGVDLLIGTNADEWLMYVDAGTTSEDVARWVAGNTPAAAGELLESVSNESDPRRAMDRLRSAREMRCPSRRLAGFVSETGGRAWVYRFSRVRNGPGGQALGAYHGAELPYVFGTHDAWLPTDAIDLGLTSTVMDYWVQFARSGDPNVSGRPAWPRYDPARPRVMELGDRVAAIAAPDQDLCLAIAKSRKE